jgi:hypothetical protein
VPVAACEADLQLARQFRQKVQLELLERNKSDLGPKRKKQKKGKYCPALNLWE